MAKRPREEETPFDAPPLWISDYVAHNFPGVDIVTSPLYLTHPWAEWSFLFPPMSQAHLYIAKAVKELQKGHNSILLVPATFNSSYFRELVAPNAAEIRILTCPLRLDAKKTKTVHQMCFIVFAPKFEGDEEAGLPAVTEPFISMLEIDGWKDQYYKRQRNRKKFGEN